MSRSQRQRAPDGTVLHKPLPECPISQPHDSAVCGVVLARRRSQERMTERGGPPEPPAGGTA